MIYLVYKNTFRKEGERSVADNLIKKGWREVFMPEYDPKTQYVPKWIGGQWVIQDIPEDQIVPDDRKVWKTVSDFLDEFTIQEKIAFVSSTEPAVKLLYLKLTTWLKEVWSDHSDVLAAFSILTQYGILTQERITEICSKEVPQAILPPV